MKSEGVIEMHVAIAAYSGWFKRNGFNNFAFTNMEDSTTPKHQFNPLGFEKNSSAWVRSEFITFFENKGHVFWASSPVLPHNDPTLLFANAGMNQFKDIIVGKADSSTPYGRLKRACNTQKCIRAGGKHNDLDDVGRDSYHHTFFEMLGNWSFGDYFKKEAIDYAWELLTKVYQLDEKRLYVTYFGGDPKTPNCPPDEEARQYWLKYLPAERVLPFGVKDNFWEMADTGPCGPCSEIHYDHIGRLMYIYNNLGNRDAAKLVNADDPTVVELWNLVFMQYNRNANGSLEKLPKPCVDTGMGLERVCAVLKGSSSNYDSDLFMDICAFIKSLIPSLPPYGGTESPIDVAYRVVADHARCLTIAIGDGVEPSNEGRGYVLRRILRRAVRYAQEHLGGKDILHKLVDVVIKSLGTAFPEIAKNRETIKQVIHQEESLFLKTLDKGVERFKKIVADGKSNISGDDAFLLYTTFGFPLDLTQLMAREHNLTVDLEGFNQRFKEHQQLSEKRATKFDDSTQAAIAKITQDLSADVLNTVANYCNNTITDDSLKYDWSGDEKYEPLVIKAKVLAIFSTQGLVDSTRCNQVNALVLDKTSFYAESGGQIWDEGTIGQVPVVQVQKMAGMVFHFCSVNQEALHVGDEVELKVNYGMRINIACNHTGTHLLNFVLRGILGDGAYQRGSKLDAEKFTFDFASKTPLSEDTIAQVESQINSMIKQELPVVVSEINYKDAMQVPGIRAHFGETYPEKVRLVAVSKADKLDGITDSIELCGGTHVSNTRELKRFHIISEEGTAKGIRRLTCITREAAETGYLALQELKLKLSEFQKLPTYASVKDNTDTGSLFKIATENLGQLSTFRFHLQNQRLIPILEKRKLVSNLEALVNDQNSIVKLHQKRLAALAKTRATKIIDDLKSGNVSHLNYTPGPISILRIQLDDIEGDAKNLNVCVAMITRAIPNLAIVATSKGPDGTMTCRCTSPNGDDIDALQGANEAAPKGKGDIARGSKTNASWTIGGV
ncbi:bifunctional Alanine-tRNA ligase [Babesia duncani]|uniref:Alanine--tRNA ligase n=1 Tax=Babesia duncani TaxID=323732 RepID=A0AAD9PPB7_9APIC|nr:bifunctional Alanine-tRNA ligase [Babesia duncani]